MAEFTKQDKEKLEELAKALNRYASTSRSQPWHEHFSRETSAKAGRNILAAQIIQGFSGSWAASYNYGYGASIQPDTINEQRAFTEAASVPVRAKTTKLGQRGVPDIDFVPYNWRTNRFGSKGPSLVGHPICYEVVGPTLKSPSCDWTWRVSPGAGPNGGDTLEMAERPDGALAVVATLAGAYGPDVPNFTIGDVNEPLGGLYVLIADDGTNPGSIPAGQTPMTPRPRFLDTAKYELFRVASVNGDTLELHPGKPLSPYYDLSAPPHYIRAITLVRPYVARLAAVPQSGMGPGRERIFVTISPEVSASSDLYPPYDGGNPGDDTWLQGGFDDHPAGVNTPGHPDAYLGRQPLPIPLPLRKGVANPESEVGLAPNTPIGHWFLHDDPSTPISSELTDVGLILRVYDFAATDSTPLTLGTPGATLGWFPIVGAEPDPDSGYIVSRTAEVNPLTGQMYFGPGPFYNGDPPQHQLVYTVHEPVSWLWAGGFNHDKVAACRLTNLISPQDVSRFEKQVSEGGPSAVSQPGGASFSGPDKAIWDTSLSPSLAGIPNAANPGSLLDLGFRMVLFPAREDGAGNAVPDFDHPIDTRGELIIDPSVNEPQYLEVDYDGGIVRASHAPPDGGGGALAPNGIVGTGTNNRRGEVVLFGAFVPYSMEESQLGAGPRVVGQVDGLDVDAFSTPIRGVVDQTSTTSAVSAPYVGPSNVAPNPVEIVLEQQWRGPKTGVIEIRRGGSNGASLGLWGYTSVRDVNVGGEIVTALGGISSLSTVTDPGIDPAGDPLTVVLRREVTFALRSGSKDLGIDNVINDTVYGSAARAATLRFSDANVRREMDGSLTVVRTAPPPPGVTGLEFYQTGILSAARGEANPVVSRNNFSTTGFFDPAAYDSTAEGGVGGPATTWGNYQANEHGPYIQFEAINAGDWNGVIAAGDVLGVGNIPHTSRLQLDQKIRLVVKFAFPEIAADPRYFVGLFGSSNLGTNPVTVEEATGLPQIEWRVAGIRLASGDTDLQFVSSGPGGPNGVNAIPVDNNTHHLVIETDTDPGQPLRMALYDAEFNLEASHTFTDPAFHPEMDRGLSLVAGVRKVTVDPGRPSIRIHHATAVLRYDLALG